jgi:phosphoribosylanthranilate isomerase
MSVLIKICGLSTPETAASAARSGADYVGLVFVSSSPRVVAGGLAAATAEAARAHGAKIVALLVDADDAAAEAAVRAARPDVLQLHGGEGPDRAAELRDRFGLPVWKAFGVSSLADLAAAADYAAVDGLLFDARPPAGADRTGGHGAAFDWTILQGFRSPRPWFLAGGLTPENVAEAVRVTGAPAVDVSSGVERERGVKDPALISAFVQAVRQA